MAGYILGGAVVGGVSGGAGAAISGAGFAGASTLGIAAGSTINSAGMYALSGGKTDFSTSFGAFSVNWSQGEVGYLGKSGNSGLENFGYALGAFANLNDLGKAGTAILHTEKGAIGHSGVSNAKGETLIDYGPDNGATQAAAQGKYAAGNQAGALSKFYGKLALGERGTNQYGLHGATRELQGVNMSAVSGYGKFLNYMTTKGVLGVKLPYSFAYSSCSIHAGIGLMLGGVPNIPLHPMLLDASAMLWQTGVSQSLINQSYNLQY